MEFGELEREVDRALRGLPVPRAPRTLAPRVLAAAARLVPRPWYTRAWLTWPRTWQVASAAVVALIATGLLILTPHVDGAINQMVGASGTASGWLAAAVDVASLVAGFMRTVWHAVLLPLGVMLFVIALAVALAGGACVNVITRVSLGAEGGRS